MGYIICLIMSANLFIPSFNVPSAGPGNWRDNLFCLADMVEKNGLYYYPGSEKPFTGLMLSQDKKDIINLEDGKVVPLKLEFDISNITIQGAPEYVRSRAYINNNSSMDKSLIDNCGNY